MKMELTDEKRKGYVVCALMILVSCLYLAYLGHSGSPDKPGGLSIQLCKSEKKEFYIRYSS